MARTRQTRKRSRPQGGRFAKRRKTFRRRTSATTSSARGNATNLLWSRRRKMRPRAYRSALLRATMFSQKYQSTNATAATINTPASVTNATWASQLAIGSIDNVSSWTSADGATPATYNGSIYVRGGYMKCTIACESSENIDVRLFLVWAKAGMDTALPTGTFIKSLNPMMSSDTANEQRRVIKAWQFQLGQNQSFSVMQKLRPKKYDTLNIAATVANDVPYWLVSVGNTFTSEAVPCVFLTEYSATLTTDVTS